MLLSHFSLMCMVCSSAAFDPLSSKPLWLQVRNIEEDVTVEVDQTLVFYEAAQADDSNTMCGEGQVSACLVSWS